MTQNTGRLNFNGSHFRDGLDMKAMIGEFVANVIIIGYDNYLNNDLDGREKYLIIKLFNQISDYVRFLLSS